MNKIQILDFLIERNEQMKDRGVVPTLDLLIEELHEDIELASRVAQAEMTAHDCIGVDCDSCYQKALAVTA